MEPVLTTKNGRIFEIWELLERVCENPGGAMAPPCPPLPTPMVRNTERHGITGSTVKEVQEEVQEDMELQEVGYFRKKVLQ